MKLVTKTVALATLLLSTSLYASEAESSFSIEIDPATYAFSGYALHLKKSFAALPNWQFGVGAYAMDFPDVLVDLNAKNKNLDWNQRLDLGIGLFVDYFFTENQEGLFIGGQLAYQEYDVMRYGVSADYSTILSMGYVGYQYYFYDNFYLKPWGGLGYQNKISGSSVVNGQEFDVAPLLLFGALHVGYKF